MTIIVIGRVVWFGALTFKAFDTAEEAQRWAARIKAQANEIVKAVR